MSDSDLHSLTIQAPSMSGEQAQFRELYVKNVNINSLLTSQLPTYGRAVFSSGVAQTLTTFTIPNPTCAVNVVINIAGGNQQNEYVWAQRLDDTFLMESGSMTEDRLNVTDLTIPCFLALIQVEGTTWACTLTQFSGSTLNGFFTIEIVSHPTFS